MGGAFLRERSLRSGPGIARMKPSGNTSEGATPEAANSGRVVTVDGAGDAQAQHAETAWMETNCALSLGREAKCGTLVGFRAFGKFGLHSKLYCCTHRGD